MTIREVIEMLKTIFAYLSEIFGKYFAQGDAETDAEA